MILLIIDIFCRHTPLCRCRFLRRRRHVLFSDRCRHAARRFRLRRRHEIQMMMISF